MPTAADASDTSEAYCSSRYLDGRTEVRLMDDLQRKTMDHRHQCDVGMPCHFGLQGGSAMRAQAFHQLLRNGGRALRCGFTALLGIAVGPLPAAFLLA
jgi:hypothetical protein